MVRCVVVALGISLFAGCVPHQGGVTNLAPAYLRQQPTVSSFQDPDASITGYHTFSVVPASVIGGVTAANEIAEKQVLFFLRNTFESKGYRFVGLDQDPDFVATVALNAEYRESQVPPAVEVKPIWIPGRTITSQSNSTGSFNFRSGGAYATQGWGNYTSETTTRTYIPGTISTQTVTRPGYTVGHFYPVANVVVVDMSSLKTVWIGTGVGTSDNADARVSGQLVIAAIADRFPNAPATAQQNVSPGIVGVGLRVFTSDGNNYFPTVSNLLTGGPAAAAGLKEEDMILSVDGRETVNRPLSETMQMLGGSPGTRVQLVVWRNGRQHTYVLTRARR